MNISLLLETSVREPFGQMINVSVVVQLHMEVSSRALQDLKCTVVAVICKIAATLGFGVTGVEMVQL